MSIEKLASSFFLLRSWRECTPLVLQPHLASGYDTLLAGGAAEMITEAPNQEGQTPEETVLKHALEELAQIQERIGPHFRRAEARTRAGRFVRALLSPVERKNGWQLAEELGERSRMECSGCWLRPTGMRRLCVMNCAAMWWSIWGTADGVLVVDETGFLKKGKKSAGVANQYSGAAHGLANSQVGVFVLYAGERGPLFSIETCTCLRNGSQTRSVAAKWVSPRGARSRAKGS